MSDYRKIVSHRAFVIGQKYQGHDTTNWLQAEKEYHDDCVRLKIIFDRMGTEELKDTRNNLMKRISHE